MNILGSNYTSLVEAVETYESLIDMYDREGISADEAILEILAEEDSALLDQLDIDPESLDNILECADIILHEEDSCSRYLGGTGSFAVEQLATSILETEGVTGKRLVNQVLKVISAMPDVTYDELQSISPGIRRCVEEICDKVERKVAKRTMLRGHKNTVSYILSRSVHGRGNMQTKCKKKNKRRKSRGQCRKSRNQCRKSRNQCRSK
jgi:hypothetical protein